MGGRKVIDKIKELEVYEKIIIIICSSFTLLMTFLILLNY